MQVLSNDRIKELEKLAARARHEVVKNVHIAQSGHVGGPLSCIDVLIYLYFEHLNIDPKKPDWDQRDRFILSKGHSAIALYAVMSLRGYFPIEELATFDAINSRMQAHPDMTVTPGLDMSSGSLGQGLSAGVGMALGAKYLGKDFHTFVMIGDGESQEGQIWEAAWAASRYRVGNLTAIVDNNKLQYCLWPEKAPGEPMSGFTAKFQAFGWHTQEIDGHDLSQIHAAVSQARRVEDKPTVIIANTVKGKGISFMEDRCAWHARVPSEDELMQAMQELGV
ncbi:MAG: transketolase [Deltaproteobacteria bacterium]|nr:transketolase [Deltaproteobacteria bacterium]